MLRSSCCREVSTPTQKEEAPSKPTELPSNLAELLNACENDLPYDAEKRLENAILERPASVTANGEETIGHVVEIRVERGRVTIDFAGAYSVDTDQSNITDIHLVTSEDLAEYFEGLENTNNQSLNFRPVQERIAKVLKN